MGLLCIVCRVRHPGKQYTDHPKTPPKNYIHNGRPPNYRLLGNYVILNLSVWHFFEMLAAPELPGFKGDLKGNELFSANLIILNLSVGHFFWILSPLFLI